MPLAALLDVYDRSFNFRRYPKSVLAPLREPQSIVDKLIADKAAIEANRNLTTEGKDAAKVSAGMAALKAIADWLTPKLAGLNADLAARKAALPTGPSPDAGRVGAMLSKLQSFSQDERAVLYNSATVQEQQLMEAAHAAAGEDPLEIGERD